MIILPATGTNLRTSQYWHTVREFKTIDGLLSTSDDCCFCVCETEIPVFAYLDDTSDKEKNDVYSWLLEVPTGAIVEATLRNESIETDYAISDDTYGLFYDVDVLKSNYWGFIVKWSNVATEAGYGEYSMTIVVKDMNSNVLKTYEFTHFRLLPYTCENAHGTVRIESWQSGYIEGGLDYRGISIDNPFTSSNSAKKINFWIHQIRYYGRFGVADYPTETDNHYDQLRNLTQVQTQVQSAWNLRLDFVKSDISTQLVFDRFLADFNLISDYNADSVDKNRSIKVSLVSVESPEDLKNKTRSLNVKFADYKQNILKRHF